MIPNTLPQGLVDNPRLDQWIGFEAPGRVRIATGKVELGQGILTALVQLAADELDVAPGRIALESGDTRSTPSEGYTSGSLSIENSGGSIRLVGAEVRAMLLAAAASRLGCAAGRLAVVDGQVLRDGSETGLDYWQLAPSLDLSRPATGSVAVKPAAARTLIGTSLPRVDLPAKVFGGGRPFIHDRAAPDLVHARIVRQPWPGARLGMEAEAALAAHSGPELRVIRRGDFVAVASDTEAAAASGAARLAARLSWTGGRPLLAAQSATGWIATQPSLDSVGDRGQAPATRPGTKPFSRTYSKPFIAHASIGPSCALARFEANRLTVWTHAQGVFPLRGALARALGLEPASIAVLHVQGAGCYGHNGADDAACDAAIVALEMPGRTVRVEWSRADELAASPFGSAMVVGLAAELSASGHPVSWTTEIWSGPHAQRPGAGGGVNMLAATAFPDPPARPVPQEIPEAAGGSATRNAPLLYDVAHQRIINHIVADLAPRTSSMRGLGAFANVFAIESFVDELAAEAGADPLRFRLAMASDPRARAVLEQAARMAGWTSGERRGLGRGRGIAYSRYKNRAGYLALVVDVHVDAEVRLERVWCAVDAGLAVNPDGVRNQVEGGIVQAASWTLKEQVLFADGRVATNSWDSYPILRFSEVPEIEITVMDRPDEPTLGVGEVAQGPTAAAIANAVADALGVRLRDLPLTRERIIAAAGG